MNEEQLTQLIDSVFETETIPHYLLFEINNRITKNKNSKNSTEQQTSNFLPFFPSSEYYSTWETKMLFPEKDRLKTKGDTALTIVLNEIGQLDYFHPCNGIVTSEYGWRDSAVHNGIDIRLKRGEKVSAAFDGMVRICGNHGSFGNVVVVRHYNGLETVYAHLSKIKVKSGQIVLAGQIVGLGGSTGKSTGAHLHFEVRFKGMTINPRYLISFEKQKLLCSEVILKKTRWGLSAYPKNGKHYTIEKGDTLFEIAKHYGTSTKSLRKINGISDGLFRLKPGQIINVIQ